ncbi:tyrosine-type recombinase/integrase [Streptomyces sp. CNQ-509]|uniref:tyrosine-type recombinase/integrase n=1 Tax=Streptomyces sp. CNQ-509 TaxID=444103 RepID=UPI00099BD4A5|nr:tyrosine-type recombinase/integrase [Streptomyces sp. CNQ-509]
MLTACLNARDRLIVALAVRVGMRRGEIAGLRLADVRLIPGRRAGCQVEGPHLHVIKRTNPNRAAGKARRSRQLPCDPLVVRLFDDWAVERAEVPGAADCDFAPVTLTGPRTGHGMRPAAINEAFEALVRRSRALPPAPATPGPFDPGRAGSESRGLPGPRPEVDLSTPTSTGAGGGQA